MRVFSATITTAAMMGLFGMCIWMLAVTMPRLALYAVVPLAIVYSWITAKIVCEIERQSP